MYKERPYLITFIGYTMVIVSFIQIIRTLFAFSPDDSGKVVDAGLTKTEQFAITETTLIMVFVCAVFILQGRNWARWLYTLFCLFVLTADAFAVMNEVKGINMDIVGNSLRGIVILCLFVPKSNRFFAYHPYD